MERARTSGRAHESAATCARSCGSEERSAHCGCAAKAACGTGSAGCGGSLETNAAQASGTSTAAEGNAAQAGAARQ